jgi:hypothetical protein
MKTYYKPQIVSPYQVMGKKVLSPQHPITLEMQKNIGKFDLTIEFEEDRPTIEMFKKISNLIAFVCRIKKGNEIIGFGHGASVINKANRFIEKTVCFARNAAFIDAVVRTTKLFDVLNFGPNNQDTGITLGDAYKTIPIETDEPISERQRDYLTQLISLNITEDDERERWMSQLSTMSKSDASEAIQSLLPDRE